MDSENIIFLGIVAAAALIIFVIMVAIIVQAIKLMARFFRRVFDIQKAPKLDKNDANSKKAQEIQQSEFNPSSQKMGNMGNTMPSVTINEEPKEIENIIKSQREKGEQSIAEDLNKLKQEGVQNTQSLSSRMPSRNPGEGQSKFAKINIPRVRRPEEKNSGQNLEAPHKDDPNKVQNFNLNPEDIKNNFDKDFPKEPQMDLYKKPEVVPEKKGGLLRRIFSGKNTQSNTGGGITIFGAKKDVNRRILKFNLKSARGDLAKEIVKDQRLSGLSLSADQRSKLIEKYMPKYYGQSISKDEMRKQIEKIQRDPKIMGTGSQRIQVKKELNFLKKIGGIK